MQTEAKTRAERIDLRLAKAGWTRDSRCLIEELPLPGGSQPIHDPSAPYGSGDAFADYALLDRMGRPVAVVEAKRRSRSPLEGEPQAADYADRIRKLHKVDPFIFLANGDEIWFWHRRLYPPRKVSGFFTLDDLERIAFQDRYHERLVGLPASSAIVNRAYQTEAVKTIAERIAARPESDASMHAGSSRSPDSSLTVPSVSKTLSESRSQAM